MKSRFYTRNLCIKCFLKIKGSGMYDVKPTITSKSEMIICWRCKKRTFGRECEMTKKYHRGNNTNYNWRREMFKYSGWSVIKKSLVKGDKNENTKV